MVNVPNKLGKDLVEKAKGVYRMMNNGKGYVL